MSKRFYLLHVLFFVVFCFIIMTDILEENKLYLFFLLFCFYFIFIASTLFKIFLFIFINTFLKDVFYLPIIYLTSLFVSSGFLLLLSYLFASLLNMVFKNQTINLTVLHYGFFHIGFIGIIYQLIRYILFFRKPFDEPFFTKKFVTFIPITVNSEKIDLLMKDILYLIKKEDDAFIFTHKYAYKTKSQYLVESMPFWLFCKISNSHIVRTSKIKKIFHKDGENYLKTFDKAELLIEKNFLHEVIMKSLYK